MKMRHLKIVTDILLTAALLFLMSYELISQVAHEWTGAGMFLLFIFHHILNRRWIKNVGRGGYSVSRAIQTLLAILIFICMLGSMTSGIILSQELFAFLDIRGLSSPARVIHMVCAYWGLVLMSLHLGIHWGILVKRAGKMFPKPSAARTWGVRLAGAGIALYGIYTFIKRDILSYMLLYM